MKRRRLLSLAVLPLSALFAATPLLAQDKPASDSILGALRISSLNDLATSAGAFANQIEPGSGAAGAQITAGAASFGLATDQEVLALLVDPQKSAQPYALVLPVANPAQFKANPAFNFQPTAASPDRYQIKLPNGQPMFATFVGKRLVVSPLEAGLDAVIPAIQADEDIRHLRAGGGQIALSLSADRLYSAYKPMIGLMLMGMRAQFAAATPAKTAQGAAAAPAGPNPADMLGSMLETVGEIQELGLSVSIKPDHLDLRTVYVATPGTASAALFNAGRGPAVTTLGLHDPSSAMLGTISARPTLEFWTAYNQLMDRFLSNIDTPDAAAASKTLAKATADFAAVWDGTASFGVLSAEKGMSGSGVAGVTDQEKTLALLRALPDLQKSMSAINTAQGLASDMVIGDEVRHGDARLLDATQTYRALNPEMAAGLELLKKMGMEKLVATYGVSSKRAVYAMGDDSRATATRLIDATDGVASPVTPAAYGLPAESTAFAAISLPRYLAWFAKTGALPLPITASATKDAPGLALTADLVDGRAEFRVHLAAAEINRIRAAFAKPVAPAAPAAIPAAAAE